MSTNRFYKKIYAILFSGEKQAYNPDDQALDIASMFGFVKESNGFITIANRIFETRLYHYFLTTDQAQNSEIFKTAFLDRPQFIQNGHLDMELILRLVIRY